MSATELIRETLEAGKALSASEGPTRAERTLTTEWILRLLVASHACLVIDTTLALVTQCLVGVVYLSKLLFGFFAWVQVWVILLG